MYARLGFSIAVHLDPDILLIDEVLAVGDEHFQKKCLERMMDFRHRGKTIVFVSHNAAAVKQLCDRACLLSQGTLVAVGEVASVLEVYEARIAV
jgi:ABC-type polysaccharide/polyol phosphate transport system ATPase subunit